MDTIRYDRDTLISIGVQYTHLSPLLNPDPCWPREILRENKGRDPYRRPRGKRAGVRNRLRARAHRAPLPSILLANVQSLENKLDDLRARVKFQRDIRDCNLLCFTETWLNPAVPDHAIQPAEFFSVYRMDRTLDSGKSRGGGVCLMVNKHWCDSASIVPLSRSCSPNLELLSIKCRPFYLPREFSSVIVSAVYIPPQADTDTAVWDLHETLTLHQTQHRDAALIVVGDFNSANLKRALPNFYQHITCPTRGERTLDHCYTTLKNGYKAQSRPPFGKSDHAAIFLMPVYKQRLKQEAPVQREVTRWTDQSVAALQDALDDADWDMFRRSSDDVNMFTEAVVGFIGKLTDDTVQKTTIRTFPNQKPWVDKTIRDALRSRSAAYNTGLATGDMDEYKAASYSVRRAVKDAKRRYGSKLESQFQQGGSRSLWQGLRTITDYKTPSSRMVNADASLADELNTFYARFEAAANHASGASGTTSVHAERAGEVNTFTISEHDVRRAFKRVNTRKAAGPDGITGRVLKACADQLAPVFTEIFNLSLEQAVVPSCFKQSTIVPVPKKPQPACLNDYRPVALTSVVMKCFERLVRDFITASLPDTLDPLQFAYRQNRSTEDAIAHLLHTTNSHLDQRNGNYTKMLFVDYSSAFNTIIPSTLTSKLEVLGLSLPLCQWISNFLTDRPQAVRVGKHTSSTLTLSTGAPQGCVLSPLLYSLYTHDCVATSNSTTIRKFADDTVVVGLISNNDETAYLQEVKNLERWCQENNLLLNVSKTKELIVDFSTKQERSYQPLNICGTPVERVDSFRYLGVHITQDLSWSCHINTLVKKARQRLYHLRRLRDFKLPSQVLKTFYTCTIESVLTGSITSWFGNSTMQDRRALQRVVRSAERTIHTELPDLQDIYSTRCMTRARKIVKDLSHPNNGLFSLLRSGKRFCSLKANTERMRRSFFPQAIRSLNQETPGI
ncbi:gastrula zinc finger protein XlCGF28.1-like [Silurus asotus]|uniref:Gastrula zinc finger protein XlCGF28.1-like n=1 Tax=Silurus asotus TaxID=30991 RepID=A0AAD5B7P0_SILAS|nr:gastrula zinc finger protein XlCGF28.1-like [Silurus asotus]